VKRRFGTAVFGFLAVAVVCASAPAARLVGRGTIGWLVKREPVGQPVPHQLLQGQTGKVTFLYERLITFDAATGLKMVVSMRQGTEPFGTPDPLPKERAPAGSSWICFSAWSPHNAGTSCQLTSRLFTSGRPLMWGVGGIAGDMSMHGLASDGVTRVTVTLASGGSVDVPLRDNAFLFRIPAADHVTSITAYGRGGKILERKPV